MRLFDNTSRLPRVYYPDQQVWVETFEDELDAIELGWRVVNALITDNSEVMDFDTLDTISYLEYEAQRKNRTIHEEE